MSNQSSLIELPLKRLETYLREERYHAHSSSWYITVARRFLRYLEKRKIVVEAAQPAQVVRIYRWSWRPINAATAIHRRA